MVYVSVSGFWRCEEFNPIKGQQVYMVEIEKSKRDSTQYWLGNFHNQDIYEGIIATLDDSSLIITQQSLPSAIIKTGAGIISTDFTRIEFNYEVFDGQSDYNVYAIFTRP